MRRILQAIVTALSLFLAAGSAQAALIDRGGGLIYDTVLDITWLQNANLAGGSSYDEGWSHTDGRMSFANATAWAADLSYFDSVRGVTYSDWRLPQGLDLGAPGAPPGPFPWKSSPGCNYAYIDADCGYNMNPMSSELVHLFYVDLGNLAFFDTAGIWRGGASGVTYGLLNSGPFINVDNYIYWSVIVNPIDPTQEWRHFKFNDGRMSWRLVEDPDYHAWGVRDGDVASISSVPEPETYALLLAGLGLLGFVGRRRKHKEAA